VTRSNGASDSIATLRQLRIIGLLDAAERLGATPLPLIPLHTIAYFTDALAPVWNLPIIDGQILKRLRPYYPSLQADLDRLVGRGVVAASEVHYVREEPHWRLDANYALNRQFADRILAVVESFPMRAGELGFVREVVYAASGLGVEGLQTVTELDATYSDPLVDVGGMIEVERDPGEANNLTAQVALRFGELLDGESTVSTAEMVNLYMRRLYARTQVA
jgi:hypothetical protein